MPIVCFVIICYPCYRATSYHIFTVAMGGSAKAADSPAKGSDESLSVCCRLNLDDDDGGGHKADITATQRKRNHQQILKASRFFFPSNSPIPEAFPVVPVLYVGRGSRTVIQFFPSNSPIPEASTVVPVLYVGRGSRTAIQSLPSLPTELRRAACATPKNQRNSAQALIFELRTPIATLLVLIKVGEPYRLVRTVVLKRFDASRTNASHSVQIP